MDEIFFAERLMLILVIAGSLAGDVVGQTTVTPTTTPEPGLTCLLCANGSSPLLCEWLPVHTVCKGANDVCFSRTWRRTPGSSFFDVHKSCMDRETCEQLTKNTDASCARGVIGESCTFCCQRDKCNTGYTGSLPESCSREMEAFKQCTEVAISEIMNTTVRNNATCKALKLDLENLEACRVKAAKTCIFPMETYLIISKQFLQRSVDRVCKLFPEEEWSELAQMWRERQEKEQVAGSGKRRKRRSTRPNRPTNQNAQSDAEFVSKAKRCFKDFLTVGFEGNTSEHKVADACRNYLPGGIKCANGWKQNCTEDGKDKIMKIIQFAKDNQCLNYGLRCNTSNAESCINKASERVINDTFGSACRFHMDDYNCLSREIDECNETDKDNIISKWKMHWNNIKDHCRELFIECQDENETVVLVAGEASHKITFKVNQDPSVICGSTPNCSVYLDFITEGINDNGCRGSDSSILIGDITDPDYKAEPYVEITEQHLRQMIEIRLMAKLYFQDGNERHNNFHIALRKMVNESKDEIESGNLCSYKVTIKDDRTGKVCSSTNDPHIRTFDSNFYDCHHDGFFNLYRHKSLPYQVQARYEPCYRGSFVRCNCGVYIQSYQSVYVLNGCQRRSYEIYIMTSTPFDIQMRTSVSANSRKYDVVLPHGQRIKIHTSPPRWSPLLINIYLYSSAHDFNKTEGLCGLYDDNPNNDEGITSTMRSDIGCVKHKVPDAKRLDTSKLRYNGKPPKTCLSVFDTNMPNGPPLCDNEGYMYDKCSLQSLVDMENTATVFKQIRGNAVSRSRKKRQSDVDKIIGIQTSTDFNFNETEAREACINYLLDQEMVQNCLRLPKLDLMPLVKDCTLDLMYTGNTHWLDVALSGAQSQCDNEIKTKAAFAEGGPGEELVKELIEVNLCPDNCSGNGLCVEGECRCIGNFYGVDCSQERGLPPSGISIPDDGLCDVTQTDCSAIIVNGDHFIQTDTLQCELIATQVIHSHNMTNESFHVKAALVNMGQVSCELPQRLLSYTVKVTLDGNSYSAEKSFVPYSPVCNACDSRNGEIICTRLDNNCIVDRECFAAGYVSIDDKCFVCSPENSTSQLIKTSGTKCSQKNVPSGLSIAKGGICDITREDCSVIIINGDQFTESDMLQCELTSTRVLDTDTLDTERTSLVRPNLVSVTQISCEVPERNQSYKIKVTLNGQSISEEMYFVPYNPICHGCENFLTEIGEPKCTRLESSCIVDKQCFAEGYVSTEDPCYVCVPEKASSEFTRKAECKKEGNLGLIVGLSVAVVVVVVVVATTTICCKKRSQKKETYHPTQIQLKEAPPDISLDSSKKVIE